MWTYTLATGIFLIFSHIRSTNGWRSFTINISNVSTTTYSDKVKANITAIENALNMYFQINEELSHPEILMEVFFQSPDTGHYNVELMNRTINLCKLFTNQLYEPLIQIIYRIIQDHGEIPNSCPIKKRTLTFENVMLDAERFPPYLPERKGYSRVTFYERERNLLLPTVQSVLFFEIKSKAGKRFKAIGSI